MHRASGRSAAQNRPPRLQAHGLGFELELESLDAGRVLEKRQACLG